MHDSRKGCGDGLMGTRGNVGWAIFVALIDAGLVLSGCAIQPLPEDYTHVPTYTIARQIRCEARQAAIDSIINYLTKDHHVDSTSRKLGEQLKWQYDQNHNAIATFNTATLRGEAKQIVGLIYDIGIAYNFDLTSLETNNIDPAVNLIRPMPTNSLLSASLGGTFDRSRQSERSFTITDSVKDLLQKVREDYCTKALVEENIVYPITGRVGIGKVVRDFLELALFANLTGQAKDAKTVVAITGPPTFVTQLLFTTTIGAGATPKIVFSPVGQNVEVGDTSVGFTVSRKDTHQLTVGLSLDEKGAKSIGTIRKDLFTGTFITASGTGAKQTAALAVEQFLALKIFRQPAP
ncbi:MAG: hypothetical protein WBA62_17165 [Xanthobacteraceae bacterium]